MGGYLCSRQRHQRSHTCTNGLLLGVYFCGCVLCFVAKEVGILRLCVYVSVTRLHVLGCTPSGNSWKTTKAFSLGPEPANRGAHLVLCVADEAGIPWAGGYIKVTLPRVSGCTHRAKTERNKK